MWQLAHRAVKISPAEWPSPWPLDGVAGRTAIAATKTSRVRMPEAYRSSACSVGWRSLTIVLCGT